MTRLKETGITWSCRPWMMYSGVCRKFSRNGIRMSSSPAAMGMTAAKRGAACGEGGRDGRRRRILTAQNLGEELVGALGVLSVQVFVNGGFQGGIDRASGLIGLRSRAYARAERQDEQQKAGCTGGHVQRYHAGPAVSKPLFFFSSHAVPC